MFYMLPKGKKKGRKKEKRIKKEIAEACFKSTSLVDNKNIHYRAREMA